MRTRLNLILLLAGLLSAALTGAQQPAATAEIAETAQNARQAALDENAPNLAGELFEDAEVAFGRAIRFRDQGKPEKATAEFGAARQLFLDAELTAIQNRVLAEARRELTEARKARAKKYAPRTLARAEQLTAEALTALSDDRNAIDRATALADNAAATARLAQRIVRTARDKPAVEELLLNQARGIWQLQTAAELPQEADQNMLTATDELAAEIIRLREREQRLDRDLTETRAYSAALEEEIRILDERLGGATAERRQLVMRLEEQARAAEQLEQAKTLFTADEAEVFEQSGIIIARLTGLNFASGSAELNASTDGLFAKLRRLLSIYPGATVNIEGHTDSKGGDRLNQRLSQNRAQAVMNRIVQDSAFPPDRIAATGFGETRPIANNETEAGRAQNRRIDVLIKPAP